MTTPYETNNIQDSAVQHSDIDHSRTLSLGDPDLKAIRRLRLLTDPGYPVWEISYCYGETKAGDLVRVDLGIYTLPKGNIKGALIQAARQAGVHAKTLHLLDDDIISKLC